MNLTYILKKKWVSSGFEVTTCWKIFWQNFGQYVLPPPPRRRHAWINFGSNFKNARNMLSCMSNCLFCFKGLQTYISLLCLWCMVKEILAEGQPKVKWVKFSTASDLHVWGIKLLAFLYTCQNIRFYVIWTFGFEIIAIILIQSMIIVEEVLNCRMAIFDYRKFIICITV